jgi:hypothetical protein
MEETEPSITHVEGGESKWKVKSLMCTEEDAGSRKSLVPITQLHRWITDPTYHKVGIRALISAKQQPRSSSEVFCGYLALMQPR